MKLLVLIFFIPTFLNAQNLVLNGSFEEYIGKYFDSHYAAKSVGWKYSQNSADCYHSDFDLYADKFLKDMNIAFQHHKITIAFKSL